MRATAIRGWLYINKSGIKANKYLVSRSGEIAKRNSDGTIVTLRQTKVGPFGYRRVQLKKTNGKYKSLSVARLVANKYLGMPWSSRLATHHKDKNLANNAASNLAWMMRGEHTRLHLGAKIVAKRRNVVVFRANSCYQMSEKLGCSHSGVYFAYRRWTKTIRGLTIHNQ